MKKPVIKEIGVYMSKETFDHKRGKDTLVEGFDYYDSHKEWEFERLGDSDVLNKVKKLWVASEGKWQGYFTSLERDCDMGPILRWHCRDFVPLPNTHKPKRKPFRGFTYVVPRVIVPEMSPPVIVELDEDIMALDGESEYIKWFDIELHTEDFRRPDSIIIRGRDVTLIYENEGDPEIDFEFFRGDQHIIKIGFGFEKFDNKVMLHNGREITVPTPRQLKNARKIQFQKWPLPKEAP